MKQYKSDRQAFWYGVRDGLALIVWGVIAGAALAMLIS